MFNAVRLPVQVFSRKLQRSFAHRGFLGTIRRSAAKPLEIARRYLREASPAYRRCHREELEFDRRLNVNTCRRGELDWISRIAGSNWMHGIGYAPVPIEITRSLLATLDVDFPNYTFIDYGAGKGRMLFIAAEFPFRRIIGVEYAVELFETLKGNLENLQHPAAKCNTIEGVLADAAQYEPPLDPLVLFFHHPFESPVFRQVLDRITESLEAAPRDVRIIYFDPACRELIDNYPRFTPISQGKRDPYVRYSADWIVYAAKGEMTKEENDQRGNDQGRNDQRGNDQGRNDQGPRGGAGKNV